MTLWRRTFAPTAALVVLLAAALAFANAPAALADTTLSQDVAPGGSLSTGSTVSATDPVQLTLTAPQGGEFTIDEVTAPQSPTFGGSASLDWFGPQFTITTPDDEGGAIETQTLTITMLADPAVLPAAPTWGANPQWRSASAQQKLCASRRYSFCITTQADLVDFCDWQMTDDASFGECTAEDSQLGSQQLLPDGDVQVTMQMEVAPSGITFGASYPSWSCVQGGAVVNAPTYGTGTLDDLIAHGLYYDDDCTWASTVTATVTVTAALAHRLHLQSSVIAHIDDGPGGGQLELAAAARSALRRFHKAIDIRVALDARGTQPGQAWSATQTLHVPS